MYIDIIIIEFVIEYKKIFNIKYVLLYSII